MSVIGTVEAVPNRLQILWNVLRETGTSGIERERLKGFVVPHSLGASDGGEAAGGTSLFDESLNELIRAGFAEVRDRRVTLVEPTSGNFLESAEKYLLSPNIDVNNERSYLAGAIAWFLTRTATRPLPWRSAPSAELRDDLGEIGNMFDITNVSRWQNFAYWARFLGYASIIDMGGQPMVVPDPKTALRRHLDAALPSKQETPIGPFLDKLAKVTPVFEGGAVRRMIEGRLAENRRRGPHGLSPTTSLALRRLQIAGELRPIRRDDAEIWTATGVHDGRISHLTRG